MLSRSPISRCPGALRTRTIRRISGGVLATAAAATAATRLSHPILPNQDGTHAIPNAPLRSRPRPDPFAILSPQITSIQDNLLRLLGSSHPSLTDIAQYYFLLPGKQLRPLLILLISRATNGLASGWSTKLSSRENASGMMDELDRPLSSPEVLTDYNPRMPDHSRSFEDVFSLPLPSAPLPQTADPFDGGYASTLSSTDPHLSILPTQMRLAQIGEMIHVSSLLHDDVIDEASMRRAAPSAPFQYGNKLAILGGDFLLGRTSAALSRLGEAEVVELIASIISNLIEGEVMQAKEVVTAEESMKNGEALTMVNEETERWTRYLQKTYYKTASLMAKTARSAVVLGGATSGSRSDELLKDVAYAYGRNLGIAFQIVDDALDFSPSSELGKPGGGADLQLGLATAPTLYAWEEHAEMGPLIRRRFKAEGDVEKAREFVLNSDALARTRQLAQRYADKAREVLQVLPATEARDALEVLADKAVNRKR